MKRYQGTGVSRGVAIGRVRYIDQGMGTVEKRAVSDVQKEIGRFESARALAAAQLGELAVETAAKLGEKNSLLFEIHQMMLDDLDYREAVEARIIGESVCAEYAVAQTAQAFAADFAGMDDEYMQARAADVWDVSRRVVGILTGRQPRQTQTGQPAILAAADFVPSETAQMERESVFALVTSAGSANSHTAIFARTMGIPAVIGLGGALDESWDGKLCCLDGETGEVLLEPDEAALARMRAKQAGQRRRRRKLEQYRGKKAQTQSGKAVKLYANIGSVRDAELAMENDAEGIGLFRSEFLYLESRDYPEEEAQFRAYKAVAETMQGRPVIIRTLDIGADKQVDYMQLPAEENPALGLRALRLCLRRPEVFKTQLRAIYRAALYGDISIMLPMVTAAWEIRRAKEIAAEAQTELAAEGISFRMDIPVGIMIETPAAAIISDELAKEADFFSIGTNDLTQYTLALDRQNQGLEEFYNPRHEAVLRLVRQTVQNAHAAGIWCGICGELAADEELAQTFLEMGVDELSVSPPALLPLKEKICGLE